MKRKRDIDKSTDLINKHIKKQKLVDKNDKCKLLDTPIEILAMIFKYIDYKSLINLSMTCKTLSGISNFVKFDIIKKLWTHFKDKTKEDQYHYKKCKTTIISIIYNNIVKSTDHETMVDKSVACDEFGSIKIIEYYSCLKVNGILISYYNIDDINNIYLGLYLHFMSFNNNYTICDKIETCNFDIISSLNNDIYIKYNIDKQVLNRLFKGVNFIKIYKDFNTLTKISNISIKIQQKIDINVLKYRSSTLEYTLNKIKILYNILFPSRSKSAISSISNL